MNGNGISINKTEKILNIGLHIEAIDDDGNWCESEVINIIDNKIILKFLKHKEPCNRIFDISSDKWRLIDNSAPIPNKLSLKNNEFKKGDCVLAKWHDGNYYLSQILDISSKTKFGTKVKEYHIVYLYDNVEEVVPYNRLKSRSDNNIDITYPPNIDMNMKNTPHLISANNNLLSKRPYRKRGIADTESQRSNDDVLYDEKTKKFTESCKIRRLRLSQSAEKPDKDNEEYETKDIDIQFDKVGHTIEDKIKINQNSSNSNSIDVQEVPAPLNLLRQRFSQRKRRSSFRNSDYFYPDFMEHSINDKNKSSNNVSQVSTPVIHESFEDGVSKSPRLCSSNHNSNNSLLFPASSSIHLIVAPSSEPKDNAQSLSHSPLSILLPSDELLKQKPKLESLQSDFEVKSGEDNDTMYSCNEKGQYLCLICTNKTFRKKKLVLEHIKYYHPKECQTNNENNSNNISCSGSNKQISKTRYSPNKRYYSSYLKNNRRSSLKRRKQFSKFKKSYVNRTMFNNNISRLDNDNNNKTDIITGNSPELQNFHQAHLQIPHQTDHHSSDSTIGEKSCSINNLTNSSLRKPVSSIVYCHRCKKSSEDGCLVQCDVCLCWSHTSCYGLSENNKDSNSFWECDNCTNITCNSEQKTPESYRDRWRFYSIPQNEFPCVPKSSNSTKCQNNLKNICEMQSLLSISQRVLEALSRNLEKLVFKGSNECNNQDDLDIFKNLCVYDSIEEIPRLETLDVLNLNADNEEIFKVSGSSSDNATNSKNVSNSKSFDPTISSNHSNYPFNEITFSNSTPLKTSNNVQKSINTSLDDTILDCDIQKLEIIPKADFDALVKDLHSCPEMYKKTSCEDNSKASLLDFINDECNLRNPDKLIETSTNIDPDMPFSQSSCLYQTVDIMEPSEPMLYLYNDEFSNFLSGKEEPPKEEVSSCPDNCTYQTRESLIVSSSSDFEPTSADMSEQSGSLQKLTPDEINRKDQQKCKLEMEFNDLNAIIEPEHSKIDPGTSLSSFNESEMRLNYVDSKCLHWTLCKFMCVEKIVESIESAMMSSSSKSSSSSSSSSDHQHHQQQIDSQLESDYSSLSKYLQSLLYILKKSQS